MQGEYKGKSVFSRRYVGMSEEAIRSEIDRLQERVYELERALDALKSDDKEFINSIEDNQIKMEKLVKELDEKITKLQSSLDYDAPIKNHLDNVTKNMRATLMDANKERLNLIAKVLQVDTILIIILLGLFIYKSFVL
ncbi:MAG: hypothetical protein IKW81_02940 [Pseudobutyrivibrio sp.]|nr:hypothetical protein [Pseudobutyrivibrio sp.]